MVIAFGVSVAFNIASAFSNRLWGTVLAVAPVAGWIVFLAMTAPGGITDQESEVLGLSAICVIVGIFLGQALGRPVKNRGASSTQ